MSNGKSPLGLDLNVELDVCERWGILSDLDHVQSLVDLIGELGKELVLLWELHVSCLETWSHFDLRNNLNFGLLPFGLSFSLEFLFFFLLDLDLSLDLFDLTIELLLFLLMFNLGWCELWFSWNF